MKALQCEMCGSQDMVKQDGYFVCQHCGTKYSVEEAKKLMIEGTVEVHGTVKVDNSDKIDKLYQLARRAREENDSENAEKYYGQILQENPDSWEASFFQVYFRSAQTNIGNISQAAEAIFEKLLSSYDLLDNLSEDEKTEAVHTIIHYSWHISDVFASNAKTYYTDKESFSIYYDCITSIEKIYIVLESMAETELKDEKWLAACRIKYVEFLGTYYLYNDYLINKEETREKIEKLSDQIRKEEPSFVTPVIKCGNDNSGGCYVATVVYGSYDCPEVWTLRRFRDYTLAKSFFGRLFIRTYYAISPTLVKWFGKTEWFKNLWKPTLDKMVAKLNADGVEDTPYEDKIW